MNFRVKIGVVIFWSVCEKAVAEGMSWLDGIGVNNGLYEGRGNEMTAQSGK